jgi:hypothetical protein
MAGTFLIVILFIGITWILLRGRIRIVPERMITVRDIPQVISQLQQSARDGHFAVLLFVPPGSTDGKKVNLQFSIEEGVVGLDWVLLSPPNVADREKIKEFAAKLGHSFVEREKNQVRYLRATGPDIAGLGAKIIQEFYQIGPETGLELIAEGFDWPPG